MKRERRIASVHIAPHLAGWSVRLSGRKRAATVHRQRGGALLCGRALARYHGVALIVHRNDGTVDYTVPAT